MVKKVFVYGLSLFAASSFMGAGVTQASLGPQMNLSNLDKNPNQKATQYTEIAGRYRRARQTTRGRSLKYRVDRK